MNSSERRMEAAQGLVAIRKVLKDILLEADAKGQGPMNRLQIIELAELPVSGRADGEAQRWEAVAYILRLMEVDGEVSNDNPGYGPDAWRLS